MGTQNRPWNLVASLSKRPAAGRTQQGYLFLDRDTGEGYVLSINPTTKVRSWVLLGQVSAGLYATSVNLATSLGKFVRLLPDNTIEVNSAAGTESLGVLQSVVTLGGVQYGRVVRSGPATVLTDGTVFAAGDPVTNNGSGRGVAPGLSDVTLALAIQASVGSSVLVEVLETSQATVGPNEIAFGDVNGRITSDPTFTYDPATGVLEQQAANGSFIHSVGLTATRTFGVMNVAGFNAIVIDTKPASQSVNMLDALGAAFVNVDELTTANHRRITVSDGTQPLLLLNARRAANSGSDNRGFVVYGYEGTPAIVVNMQTGGFFQRTLDIVTDGGGYIFGVNATTGAVQWYYADETGEPVFYATFNGGVKLSTWYDDANTAAGNRILEIDHALATKKISVFVPFTLASYTVGALPTPPLGGAGSVVWGSNCRVGAEGGGGGTGAQLMYKAGGAAGAGWYLTGSLSFGGTPAKATA